MNIGRVIANDWVRDYYYYWLLGCVIIELYRIKKGVVSTLTNLPQVARTLSNNTNTQKQVVQRYTSCWQHNTVTIPTNKISNCYVFWKFSPTVPHSPPHHLFTGVKPTSFLITKI